MLVTTTNKSTFYINPNRVNQEKNKVSFRAINRLSALAERRTRELVKNERVQGLLKSKGLNDFLKDALESPGVYEAIVALGITCSLRPLTVMATPGNN